MTRWAGLRRRLSPDGLALQFSLLLATALLVATLIAAALLYVDRARQTTAALIEREVERIVSLVPAIEAAPPAQRRMVAREASTRVSRVFLDRTPMVEERPIAPRSAALTRELEQALGGREVRAAIVLRPGQDRVRGMGTVALSIRLEGGAERVEWLNSVSRGAREGPPGIPGGNILLIFAVSLISVLGAALLAVRRLTRPLNALASAAERAGEGDRTARVGESGPREVRQAAASFNQMQGRIAQFDAERMRTLAAVGHDLRTPITSLRIRAEMLDDADGAPMIRTLDEMSVMADGLVAYARGTSDSEIAEPLALAPMLARLCDSRGASFDAKAQPTVLARPVALGRALGNLVDNALRYGGAARVTLDISGDAAVILIDDDGPGIPPHRIAEMFEPFVRAEGSRSVETGGAGLGLAIAKSIVTAHGGSLGLSNRPEGGLRATLRLPLSDAGARDGPP